MKILSKEKVNFNSLEENTFKKMMELGRKIIVDELMMLDKAIKEYRDKEIFKVKDMQTRTVKTKLGEITYARRRYEMTINGTKKYIYLLDELMEISEFGQYSQGIVEMVVREVIKKSYRETAKTITEDTESQITYSAVRNIVIAIGKKIKEIEEEKIRLYEKGEIEGQKSAKYVFCEHDGIYVKKQAEKKKDKKMKKNKQKKKKEKKNKRKGIELKIAVIHEGKEKRYSEDYKLKNKILIGTALDATKLKRLEDMTIGTTYKEYELKKVIINGDGADWTGNIVKGAKEIFQLDMAHIQRKIYMAVSDEEYLRQMQHIVHTEKPEGIFSLIYNYKVELESEGKNKELEKVKELEEYLRKNKAGIKRYQYKLGYTNKDIEEKEEEIPTLGSEESEMYCVCRDRMKKRRMSWSETGAEAMLKVIVNHMNSTIKEVITKKAKEKIVEELAQRVAEPVKVKKEKQGKIIYAGKYQIANNFTGKAKDYVINLLREKECSELRLIN